MTYTQLIEKREIDFVKLFKPQYEINLFTVYIIVSKKSKKEEKTHPHITMLKIT